MKSFLSYFFAFLIVVGYYYILSKMQLQKITTLELIGLLITLTMTFGSIVGIVRKRYLLGTMSNLMPYNFLYSGRGLLKGSLSILIPFTLFDFLLIHFIEWDTINLEPVVIILVVVCSLVLAIISQFMPKDPWTPIVIRDS